ncbi:unnamed protein product [Macrosiphum euphorbiae]|uniref:Uncharacterized protein n=1 Tax=Macrosiphum euphorbiae TaxID=13131 RepID=A0AAV0W5B1_9HEMI|nr:unnamed protein product [Macrosiphum euphorbiae]
MHTGGKMIIQTTKSEDFGPSQSSFLYLNIIFITRRLQKYRTMKLVLHSITTDILEEETTDDLTNRGSVSSQSNLMIPLKYLFRYA